MLCPSLMPAASCGGVGRKSPVLLLLSKKENRPGATSGAVPLWNEDKMKKMKLSLASIILTNRCYTKNT